MNSIDLDEYMAAWRFIRRHDNRLYVATFSEQPAQLHDQHTPCWIYVDVANLVAARLCED